MTLDEVVEMVKHIEYRPGWTIEVRLDWAAVARGPFMYIGIHARGMVEDAYNPGQKLMLFSGKTFMLGDLEHFDPARMLYELHIIFEAVERHECAEFFKYKGRRPFDPHQHAPDAMKEALR